MTQRKRLMSQKERVRGKKELEKSLRRPLASTNTLHTLSIGVEVTEWPLTASGLLYDRQWAVVDARGKALRQKDVSSLSFITPSLDLERGTLRVSAPQLGMEEDLLIPLSSTASEGYSSQDEEREREGGRMRVTVCGDPCESQKYGRKVAEWFSLCLGRPCTLVRNVAEKDLKEGEGRSFKGREKTKETQPAISECLRRGKSKIPIGFANESPLLLVSMESVQELTRRTLAPSCERVSTASQEIRLTAARL